MAGGRIADTTDWLLDGLYSDITFRSASLSLKGGGVYEGFICQR